MLQWSVEGIPLPLLGRWCSATVTISLERRTGALASPAQTELGPARRFLPSSSCETLCRECRGEAPQYPSGEDDICAPKDDSIRNNKSCCHYRAPSPRNAASDTADDSTTAFGACFSNNGELPEHQHEGNVARSGSNDQPPNNGAAAHTAQLCAGVMAYGTHGAGGAGHVRYSR